MEIEGQLRATKLHDIGSGAKDIIGSVRINPKSYTDAFVTNPDGGPDIYIEGIGARNAALDGDIVQVKLSPQSQWKLNRNIIANRWDDWAQYLLPLITKIEETELRESINGGVDTLDEDDRENSEESSSYSIADRTVEVGTNGTSDKPPRRRKRSASSNHPPQESETKTANAAVVSKLPSNLPPGISKLQVGHVIDLPFSSQCIQKTGFVIEIVKRNHQGIAGGTLRKHSNDFALFSPTDTRVPRMLIEIQECPLDFSSQPDRYAQVLFVARMTHWDGGKNFARGNLVRIVGDCNSVQSRMEALLMEHQIYDSDFPPDAYAELEYLKNLPADWFAENSRNRRNLTDECVFTIDPKTARDLDDAVSIKQVAEQIYEVGVHIADVSHFVKELSAVDYYARLRTTSVYLVDRVIPMLPRALCEQMCSLNPGEPKLTFSVIWKMDKYGRIIDEWFGRTIIKSCAKLAYEQVQDMINKPNDISWIKEGSNMPKLYAFDWKYISKSVAHLNKIAQNLRAKRFEGGALRIGQVKIKYELDPDSGFPTGFAFEDRTDANFLIEEYMLLANMAVAKRIYKHSKEMAFLRRHPTSTPNVLTEVKEFCEAKGCQLDITSSGSIQRSLNAITDPLMSKVVSFLLLRAMKNAEYICVGSLPEGDNYFSHFALNTPFYTHFTSPIRRYADVIVHRQLELALEYSDTSNEDVNSLALMADECTKRKISSKTISDTSQKLYFNLFVQKAGFCELLACVTRIYDQSFDVILVDFDRTGRVYLDNLKSQLESFKFESFSGNRRLVLKWNPTPTASSGIKSKKKKKKKNVDKECADQLNSRSDLETTNIFCKDSHLRANEAVNGKQSIEVFDLLKVIVTIDKKDVTQLRIALKAPDQ